MSLADCKPSSKENPPSISHIQDQIRSTCEDIIRFCTQKAEITFYQAEQSLQTQLSSLACLFFQLFLMSFHEQFDYETWLEKGKYSKGALIPRTIKSIYGEVQYWRIYLIRKDGGGFYPVDACIGLTGDGFSPVVMSLVTR